MPKEKEKIEKALSPEEQAILSDIKSLVGQLEMIGTATQEPTVIAAKAEDEKDEKKEDKKEDEKDATKSAEGTTASDDAEARLEDDLGEENKKNIDAVKALVSSLDTRLNKSSNSSGTLIQAITGLTKVVKGIAERQNQFENAFESFIDGMGLADEIRKSYETEKQKNNKPVQSTDTSQILAEILKVQKGISQGDKTKTETKTVRKSLADKNVLTALLT